MPETLFEDFRQELAAQGLPKNASLADLIRHHRGNAALAAGADRLSLELALKAAYDLVDDFVMKRIGPYNYEAFYVVRTKLSEALRD